MHRSRRDRAADRARRRRRRSTSPATGRRSSTKISPSGFPGPRSATISAFRSTTAPARSPKPGMRRASPSPSTSAARTRRRTSCAGPLNMRIWEERDPQTQQVVAIAHGHRNFQQRRVFWMDGRPHPSPNAEHTWMGFSTGVWRRRRARRDDDAYQADVAPAERDSAERQVS